MTHPKKRIGFVPQCLFIKIKILELNHHPIAFLQLFRPQVECLQLPYTAVVNSTTSHGHLMHGKSLRRVQPKFRQHHGKDQKCNRQLPAHTGSLPNLQGASCKSWHTAPSLLPRSW